MKISIVIPNYNGEKLLQKNLFKVLEAAASDAYDSEIIISDDCSTDRSIEVINNFIKLHRNKKTKIKLLTSQVNKGFSTNVNRGVRASNGKILILLNTDVVPSENFIDFLIPHFKDERVFAVGCLDESIEGDRIVLRGRGRGVWEKGFLIHSAASLEGQDTLWVSGGSGAFRKSIWDKLGGLDMLYDPFYWEDIDLSYRARKSGFKTIFEKKSVVRHEHEKGVIKTKFNDNQIKKIAYRNQYIFAWKNSDTSNLFLNILWSPFHLMNALIDKDYQMIKGFIMAVAKLPIVFKTRNKSKKLFVKSDYEVTQLA